MSDFGNYSSLLKYEEVKQQINELLQTSQKAYGRNYKSDTEVSCTDTFYQISDQKNLAVNLSFLYSKLI